MGIRDGKQILEMMLAYQVPCLLAAAADLDLFEKLAPAPRTAAEVAAAAGCDLRAVTILLDALAAVGVIVKQDEQYSISPELAPFLCEAFPQSVMATCCVTRRTACAAGRDCRGLCTRESRSIRGRASAAKTRTKRRSLKQCTWCRVM